VKGMHRMTARGVRAAGCDKRPSTMPARRNLRLNPTRVNAVEAARGTEEDKLITSPNDDRKYKLVTLPDNGLEVLLISDEDADSAAAAMGINCGSWCDPRDIPGMAHFLEHMMFLGTEKYPEENDYSSYLNQHGGFSNAFTSSETTVFYFTVDSKFLENSLDRFSWFFKKPLFNAGATDREINAIDSEHKQYLQSDFRRLYEVLKAQSNTEHPFSMFATGDKTTLGKPDIRDRLVDFHNSHYSSNLMRLTVYGKEPIDTLESWANKMFKDVPNNKLEKPDFPITKPVFPEETLSSQISILPIADEHSLMLTWPVPIELKDIYRENPHGFLSYVLSSEAPKGLVSELKEKEWIAGLSGRVFMQSKDLNVFSVSVDLTDLGVGHIDSVVDMVYQYLGKIKRGGIDKKQWEELVNLAEVDFRFAEKGDPSHLASTTASRRLDDQPLADLLSPPSRQIWNPALIEQLIDSLRPEKMMLFVQSQKPFGEGQAPAPGEKETIEKWYGTRYRKKALSAEQLKQWKASFEGKRRSGGASSSELELPPYNPYIPSDFSLVEEPLPTEIRQKKQKDETGLWSSPGPNLVRNDSSITLWHSSDAIKEFPVPRVQTLAVMRTDLAHESPRNQVLTEMFLDLTGDYLMEALYLSSVAGYSFSMGSSDSGFTCAVQGYSQNIQDFLSSALSIVAAPPLSPTRFESIKEETLRGYENFYQAQPYEQASHYASLAVNPAGFSIPELKQAVSGMSLKDVEEFVPELLRSKWSLETLVHGNLKRDQAEELTKLFRDKLQGEAENATNSTPLQQKKQLDLGKGSSYIVPMSLTNPEELNSAAVVKLQLGTRSELSVKDLSIASLISSMIQEPAFDDLRTKQQLGYIVSAGMGITRNAFSLSVLVQGAQHSAEYYDSQIEAFLHNFGDQIAKMPEKELDSFKASLESALLRKDLTLMDRGVRYWDPIGKQLYNFSWNIDRVKALRTVTRKDLMKFYKERVLDPTTRRRLCVRMESQEEAKRGVSLVNPAVEGEIVKDLNAFRSQLREFSA